MSDRIAAAFRACRERERAALIGYLTGFDPDREGSRERLFAACEAGLDVLEEHHVPVVEQAAVVHFFLELHRRGQPVLFEPLQQGHDDAKVFFRFAHAQLP